jgi:formylglycine-generating enzyme required for sulfatase activity
MSTLRNVSYSSHAEDDDVFRPSAAPINGVDDDAFQRLFKGPGATGQVEAVRSALARALEAWWRQGQMPSIGLLRDGLLVLEAGHTLDDATRTLLLRAALFYGKGMITALRHQNDPERIASVMRDMLLHARQPMNPAQIDHLSRSDPESAEWRPALLDLLREESILALEPRQTLAKAALLYLQGNPPQPTPWEPVSSATPVLPPARRPLIAPLRSPARRSRLAKVLGLFALLLLVSALLLFWQARREAATFAIEMRTVPTGVYLISDATAPGKDRLVELQAFAIDRHEVTNESYRRCYDDGVCAWPERVTSVSRRDYFLDPALGGFPVANVTLTQAEIFCRWAGKRLPLVEEWEVAAGSALTLQRRYLFPWGDIFNVSLANSALSIAQDTQVVGTYSPRGDSPVGAADMAGNVAEWTATPADPRETPPTAYVVKGGSFLSPPEDLLVSARQSVDKQQYAPWLGFRCVLTLPAQ